MDAQAGKLMTADVARARIKEGRGRYIKMLPDDFVPTTKQLATGKIRRNDPCPCGSGKKFKKCCRVD